MMLPTQTPLAERISIVFFGLRNAGKSSLLNALLGIPTAIVSNTPGTTTDPVTRPFELADLGPVAFTDTAGIDDVGDLGLLRVQKTKERVELADLPVFVTRADTPFTLEELALYNSIKERKPLITTVLTHIDLGLTQEKEEWAEKQETVKVNSLTGSGIQEFKQCLIKYSQKVQKEIAPLDGLVQEGDFLILVTPIDLAAPQGRLILPQVETIRDVLDKDCACLVVKERELFQFYNALKLKPKLVVCDSQAFAKVAADLPDDQPLTSFSILFARKKGDLQIYLQGIEALKDIPPKAKILVLEACAHHKQADDIGTVKIPRLFHQMVQGDAEFHYAREIPEDSELAQYSLVINCAGCTASRNKILARIERLKALHIPATNYGLFLAWANGLLPRAVLPFRS